MSRLKNLLNDKECHNVKHNIFCCDYIQYNKDALTDNEKYKPISLKEILTIWGYESFYDEMIDRCIIRIQNNTRLNTCIYYDTGEFNNDHTHQKVLGFDIYNEETNSFSIVGGILFHNDEMSFHT